MTDDATIVDDALTRYYVAHRLPPDGGANANWFHVRLGPISIPLPNPPARRRAVILHDIHHLLTGYDTVFSSGEMEIAAYEIGAGCGRVWVAWLLNLPLFGLGLLWRPRRVVAAFMRGQRAESLYTLGIPLEELRASPVGALRARVGL